MRGSEIRTSVNCPNCDVEMSEYVVIPWGRIPPRRIYQMGDEVEWVKSGGLLLKPYKYNRAGDVNFGLPSINVLLLDNVDFDPEHDLKCKSCRKEIDGVGVLIESNRLKNINVFMKGELFKPNEIKCHIFEVKTDGKLVQREDLYNHEYDVSDLR